MKSLKVWTLLFASLSFFCLYAENAVDVMERDVESFEKYKSKLDRSFEKAKEKYDEGLEKITEKLVKAYEKEIESATKKGNQDLANELNEMLGTLQGGGDALGGRILAKGKFTLLFVCSTGHHGTGTVFVNGKKIITIDSHIGVKSEDIILKGGDIISVEMDEVRTAGIILYNDKILYAMNEDKWFTVNSGSGSKVNDKHFKNPLSKCNPVGYGKGSPTNELNKVIEMGSVTANSVKSAIHVDEKPVVYATLLEPEDFILR